MYWRRRLALQGTRPDRLLHALAKGPKSPSGFRPPGYDEAIARTAREIDRIQSTHGADAFALLSGASLTIEKAYLMGRFARVCLKTKHIDYNGQLCMVSSAAHSSDVLELR